MPCLRHAATAVLAIAPTFAAASASAALDVTLDSYSTGLLERTNLSSTSPWNASNPVWYFSAGAYEHVFSTSDGQAFRAWCTEFNQGIVVDWSGSFDLIGLEGAPLGGKPADSTSPVRNALLEDLFARWIDGETGTVAADPRDANAASAAFQLLVWEIAHENFATTTLATALPRISIDLGAFRANASGDTRAWFDAMASSLGSDGWRSAQLEVLVHPTVQDQIRLVPGPGVYATLVLAGCVGLRRRRR